jgi:hypothetical protein
MCDDKMVGDRLMPAVLTDQCKVVNLQGRYQSMVETGH